jgi:hypothetical protein
MYPFLLRQETGQLLPDRMGTLRLRCYRIRSAVWQWARKGRALYMTYPDDQVATVKLSSPKLFLAFNTTTRARAAIQTRGTPPTPCESSRSTRPLASRRRKSPTSSRQRHWTPAPDSLAPAA